MNICRTFVRRSARGFVRCTHNESKSGHGESSKQKRGRIKNYVISRYMQFVTNYQNFLKKQFPSLYHVSRIFMTGMKEFFEDFKTYYSAWATVMSTGDFKKLTRREIEIFYEMPREAIKVSPALFVSVLPFTNFVLFPLLYFFPRQLLCSHFWSLQQKVEFSKYYHRQRLYNYRPVFRCLQARLDTCQDHPRYKTWSKMLGLIGSGIHPKTKDIILCMDLFKEEPYSILHMYSNHVTALLRAHGMHLGWRSRKRLAYRAFIIHHQDLAIIREGGPQKLSQEDLRRVCLFRGLNPYNASNEELVQWLEQWLTVSKEVTEEALSLLLHCPILLAYNKPSNWVLIH